ncbi:DUF4153 domain-containing protein [Sphingosinithalassobacter sp. CS137]|uniref:DUF4153 domain-containing protein n=1 Tax=Sphingosinithalassobacter sp. CS137 TaxID=2762748 RepID=UPI00165D4010|nr:DUF4153 domain-containing protein [Sphingosinithalassobacter sp. CS137]
MDDSTPIRDERDWPARPLILAAIGLVAGILCHLVLGDAPEPGIGRIEAAATVFIVGFAGLIGFTLERRSWIAALLFAFATAVVAALVTWWNGAPTGWEAGEAWRMISLALAVAIAAPLFQAARDSGGWRFPYASVHDHAWTNVVLWCAAWAFVGVVFLLLLLLDQLFRLIGIEWIGDLTGEAIVWRALVGLAFGTALGVLRESDRTVHLLQRVVATVLAVLAPVLGIGLLLFLAALPFTGLGALWDATRVPTAILLTCVIGALVLVNAVIGNAPEEESRARPLRWGAMALGVAMLPLAVLAAIATGLRIGQYGLTPERLWAVTFVAIATAYGLAYLSALVRGRGGWAGHLRPANLRLALGVCALALLLATPLVSFNLLATRDQIARLEAGAIPPEKFDWAALAYDFGRPGRAALERIAAQGPAEARERAQAALESDNRWLFAEDQAAELAAQSIESRIRILPREVPLPEGLAEALAGWDACGRNTEQRCTLLYEAGAERAMVLLESCYARPEPERAEASPVKSRLHSIAPLADCAAPRHFALREGNWQVTNPADATDASPAAQAARAQGYARGDIEVRTVTRRQLFVGGQPVGKAFE